MLHFVLGTSGVSKTKYLYDTVCTLVKQGDDKLMFIVPDQSSFETEKAFLDLLGPKLSRNVKVFGFSRLCDYVFEQTGNRFMSFADDGICNVVMNVAIEQVSDKLDLFSKRATSTDLTRLMLNSVKEYKKCSITSDTLYDASKKISDESLSKKIYETALLYDTYNAILSNSYIDPSDRLTHITDVLTNTDLFGGYTIAVDSFYGFTKQEYNLIRVLLMQSKDMYFALTTDCLDGANGDLFFVTDRTAKRLSRLAADCGVSVSKPVVLMHNNRSNTSEITAVCDNLFRIEKEPVSSASDSVTVYQANSIYDEVDFVARTIRKLIVEDGYEFNDICVITRSIDKYSGILDVVLDKYDINYFMDKPQDISSKPLIKFIVSCFDFIIGGFDKEDVLSLLKTGLTDVSIEQIADFENYLFTWDISGRQLFDDFVDNPRGFSDDMKDSDKELLSNINHTRQTIIDPLRDFYYNTKDTTGINIAKSVMKLIDTLNCRTHILSMSDELESNGEIELANEQIRLYNTFVGILDKMVSVIGEYHISAKRFCELLQVNFANTDISFIPRGIDQVDIECADRSLINNKKAVFIIGAIDGEFPHTPVESSVFSDIERKQLEAVDIVMSDSVEQLALTEKYLAYKAVCSATDRLYISYYTGSLSGTSCIPSSIITDVVRCIPNVVVCSDDDKTVLDSLWSVQSAFEYYTSHYPEKSQASRTLGQYFRKHDSYSHIVNCIDNASKRQPMHISDPAAAHDLFGTNMVLSASQVESFHMCKFEYFCKYGLRITQRRQAKIDALEYGILMHYILERFISNHKSQDFSLICDDDIKDEVSDILDEYLDKHLGGKKNKSKRFLYLYYSMRSTAASLIIHIVHELAQSMFKPVDFELKIGGDIPSYTLKLSGGISVRVLGSVDRVDVMELDGSKYIRVIDYKTGTKKYNLSDILYGINLQMLIYMSAINSGGNTRFGNGIVPAGVLYMPAVSPGVNADKSMSAEKIEKKKDKAYTMFGVLLDNSDVISGMEKDLSGVYIPVKANGKDNSSLATLEQFGAMFSKVDQLIGDMALDLLNGDVSAVPAKENYDACEYCPYKAVCGYRDGDDCRPIKTLSKSELLSQLELEVTTDA